MGALRGEAAKLVEVTDAEFAAEVLAAERPVLVDFWADWCAPCRMLTPEVEAIAGAYADRLLVAKCDVDKSPQTAARYGVLSIPTLLLFKGGEAVGRLVGYRPRRELERFVGGLVGS